MASYNLKKGAGYPEQYAAVDHMNKKFESRADYVPGFSCPYDKTHSWHQGALKRTTELQDQWAKGKTYKKGEKREFTGLGVQTDGHSSWS